MKFKLCKIYSNQISHNDSIIHVKHINDAQILFQFSIDNDFVKIDKLRCIS